MSSKVSVDAARESGRFELLTQGPLTAGGRGTVEFGYRPPGDLESGRRLWLLIDIRQWAGPLQSEDAAGPNHFRVTSAKGVAVACACFGARTLELYPAIPEFLNVCEIELPAGMARDDTLTITLGAGAGKWDFPRHPIDVFRFWLLEGRPGQSFQPTGYKTYRDFEPALDYAGATDGVLCVTLEVEGEYPRLSPANTRATPGILWGDIHGMAFNQRPLDDFYAYARDASNYDFAAAMLFSYNICLGDTWEQVKAAADRCSRPDEFVAIAGIEFGAPPDASHRNGYFIDHEGVPPIFFEERPPALDSRVADRYHPDTVHCRDLDDFYATIDRFGGFVTGHFHTLNYDREVLAEIWQKQIGSKEEETRLFDLLDEGFRFGLVGGSDTHDSMPGNPEPEPSVIQPAGFMAVLADEVSRGAIRDAVANRRVYATSGARIALSVEVSGNAMGSVVSGDTPRAFGTEVEGSGPLECVELVRRGEVVDGATPSGEHWEGTLKAEGGDGGGSEWYVVRVTQADGHRAWSSPVWFEG